METKNRGYGHWENSKIPQQWKAKWGKKPINCGSDHYTLWRDTYYEYLCLLYDQLTSSLKSSKATLIRYVTFEEFVRFAYKKSSGYISQYA